MAMKLQIFTIRKFLSQTLISQAVISLEFALKKDENYYPQVFLKECKYKEKKVVRHIHDNFRNFSYSSDEFDEEQLSGQ